LANYKRKRCIKINPASCMCKYYKRAGNGSARRKNKENAKRESAKKEIREAD
jgi:hypothetical protein